MKHLIGIIAGFVSSIFIFILLLNYSEKLAFSVLTILIIVWIIYTRTMIVAFQESLDVLESIAQLQKEEHEEVEQLLESQDSQIKKQQQLIRAQKDQYDAYVEYMRAIKNALVSQKKFLERIGFTPVVTNALEQAISYFRDMDRSASEKSER